MKAIILTILCIAGYNCIAREKPKQNSIYAEFGGPAGLYSLNIDQIAWEPFLWLKVALGIGLAVNNDIAIDVPVHLSLLAGRKSHYLELGTGIEPEYYRDIKYHTNDFQTIGFLKMGYRYQPARKGFTFQLALVPVTYFSNHWTKTWFSIALGYSFFNAK